MTRPDGSYSVDYRRFAGYRLAEWEMDRLMDSLDDFLSSQLSCWDSVHLKLSKDESGTWTGVVEFSGSPNPRPEPESECSESQKSSEKP